MLSFLVLPDTYEYVAMHLLNTVISVTFPTPTVLVTTTDALGHF